MTTAPVPEARTPSRPSSPLPTNDNCDYNNSNNSPNNISASATISNSRSVSPTSPNHQQLDHPPLPMQTNSSRPSTPSSVQSLSLPTSPQSIANHPTASSTLLPETKEKLKQEKKERHATKKLMKELASCKTMLDEMEVNPRHSHQTPHERSVNLFSRFWLQLHEESWPFLLPVNTKQFPTYKKIIKQPMDLSMIKKRIQDMQWVHRIQSFKIIDSVKIYFSFYFLFFSSLQLQITWWIYCRRSSYFRQLRNIQRRRFTGRQSWPLVAQILWITLDRAHRQTFMIPNVSN